jgi:hypothetical protein
MITQEDRQCTINVTLRRVCETVTYSECVCVCVFVCVLLIYTACNAHAPYYTYIVVCAVYGPTAFFHIVS